MIEQCKYCRSDKLEERKQFELYNPETDEIDLKDGTLCLDCGCFHSELENFYQIDVEVNKPMVVRHLKSDYDIAKESK